MKQKHSKVVPIVSFLVRFETGNELRIPLTGEAVPAAMWQANSIPKSFAEFAFLEIHCATDDIYFIKASQIEDICIEAFPAESFLDPECGEESFHRAALRVTGTAEPKHPCRNESNPQTHYVRYAHLYTEDEDIVIESTTASRLIEFVISIRSLASLGDKGPAFATLDHGESSSYVLNLSRIAWLKIPADAVDMIEEGIEKMIQKSSPEIS